MTQKCVKMAIINLLYRSFACEIGYIRETRGWMRIDL